jgi:glutamine amidotransferase-like uncharacterized protein
LSRNGLKIDGEDMKRHRLPVHIPVSLAWLILLCIISQTSAEDVILFDQGKFTNVQDIQSYAQIAQELNLNTKMVDYRFINKRDSFFDKDSHRTFKVLILPGGEPYQWFEQAEGHGINCQGVKNILNFIDDGGSIIAICICAPSIFATHMEWMNPRLKEAQNHKWNRTSTQYGAFKLYCGVDAFKGTLRGPQETNRPYPKTTFLPIKMNSENEIVREAKLPPVIYQLVVGGGSILPEKGQPLEIVGWFPNGTAAIGIVPYGKGRIIMSNPHPNITGERAWSWLPKGVYGEHARRFGWTEKMIAEGLKLIETEGDPDGPEPDWALSKAMLSYAYKKASQLKEVNFRY